MIREKAKAALQAVAELTPDVQSRRIRWFTARQSRIEPETGEITDYVADYKQCPLVSIPLDNFASDVMEPGIRIELPDEDDSSSSLDDDLEDWLSEAAINGGEFGGDTATLMEAQVRDNRLRGDGMTEIVYDDAESKEVISGFLNFQSETVTTYTRPGKSILLQPDDTEIVIEQHTRTVPATTPAGDAAAYVQYDDILGSERGEVPLAVDDVIKISNNPDTGDVKGQSDVEPVHPRVRGLMQKLTDVDEAIAAKAYAFWLFKMGSEDDPMDQDKAQDFMDAHSEDEWEPGRKQAVSGDVSIETISGEVPEVWESFQFDVEYILSALPTPKYRTGFSDNTNRDIAQRKQEDYDDVVSNERRKLEAAWQPVIQRKADELADGEEAPTVKLVIEPEQDESPLANPNFDASEFSATMDGLKQAAPGGAVEQVISPEAIVETFLKLDPDEVMPDTEEEPIDESNPQVQQLMQQMENGPPQPPQGQDQPPEQEQQEPVPAD